MCKPNKMNGWNDTHYGHTGFGKLKALIHANRDLETEYRMTDEERWELYEE